MADAYTMEMMGTNEGGGGNSGREGQGRPTSHHPAVY